ncbi:MAG: acetate/propionate family kinase [Patescibacteria group bacterium]
MHTKHLLVLNPGSSSLRLTVFEIKDKNVGSLVFNGMVSGQNGKTVLMYQARGQKQKINYSVGHNLKAWWQYIHDLLKDFDIDMVGVRVVHGGELYTSTCRIDKQFLANISQFNVLAPLHNPAAIELIKLVQATWPRSKLAASFDTAWYKDLAPEVYLYSLPLKYYEKNKIRKYGFHGLSHEAATNFAAKKLRLPLNQLQAISCHLGAGASLSWYIKGKVKDTTMGFSPNEGLTMATRSGDLPSSIVLYLAQELKMSLPAIHKMFNEQSGLLGISGLSDLREILLAAGYRVQGYKSSLKFSAEQKKKAKLALAIYIYDIKRYLASYIAMTQKLQAIVFTGTVGVNSPVIRKLVLKDLQIPKNCKIFVAPEGEMTMLAQKTLQCLLKK